MTLARASLANVCILTVLLGTSCESKPRAWPKETAAPTVAERLDEAERRSELLHRLIEAAPLWRSWEPGKPYPTLPFADDLDRALVEEYAGDDRNLASALTNPNVAVVVVPDWTLRIDDPYSEGHVLLCEGLVVDKVKSRVTCFREAKRQLQ